MNLGYTPDPPSDKDRPFAELLPRLRLAAPGTDPFLIPQKRLPKVQAGSACAANAWCRMLEMLSDVQGAPCPELAAEFVYWCARQRVAEQGFDGGSILRCNGDAVRIFGAPPESDWPSVRWSINDQPPPAAFASAYDNRIDGSYRIPMGLGLDSLDSVERAVRSLHPVAFGVKVSKDFVTYDGSAAVFSAPDVWLGGHALLVVGVEGEGWERVFTVLSSWGAWGLEGRGLARIDARYLYTAPDAWVATATVAP